jgi:hypothetical protein
LTRAWRTRTACSRRSSSRRRRRRRRRTAPRPTRRPPPPHPARRRWARLSPQAPRRRCRAWRRSRRGGWACGSTPPSAPYARRCRVGGRGMSVVVTCFSLFALLLLSPPGSPPIFYSRMCSALPAAPCLQHLAPLFACCRNPIPRPPPHSLTHTLHIILVASAESEDWMGDAGSGGLAPAGPPVHLTLKVAGVHWWYRTRSHAAELTAGEPMRAAPPACGASWPGGHRWRLRGAGEQPAPGCVRGAPGRLLHAAQPLPRCQCRRTPSYRRVLQHREAGRVPRHPGAVCGEAGPCSEPAMRSTWAAPAKRRGPGRGPPTCVLQPALRLSDATSLIFNGTPLPKPITSHMHTRPPPSPPPCPPLSATARR